MPSEGQEDGVISHDSLIMDELWTALIAARGRIGPTIDSDKIPLAGDQRIRFLDFSTDFPNCNVWKWT
jgi:hypothetical protein